MTPEKGTDIAIGLTVETRLNDRRAIVANTCIGRDASAEDINGLIDKIMAAADRQEAKYQLKDARLRLEKEVKQLTILNERFAKFQEDSVMQYSQTGRGQRNGGGSFEWSGQAKANYDNYEVSINASRELILDLQRQITEFEAVVGG